MDFEAVLERCGDFGWYQLILLLLYGYTNVLSSLHYFAQTIITFTPDHWCYHERLENKTPSELRQIFSGLARPACTSFLAVESNRTHLDDNDDTDCHRWIYDYDHNYHSVTTELNWVCDEAYQSAVGQSMFFIGSVFGTVVFGTLADRVGRLPAVLLSSLTGGIGDFATSYIQSLPAFAVGRFVSGLATDTMFYLMYIMVFEYLRPSRRTFGLNIVQITFYTLGLTLSPWLALWMRSWRRYLLLTSIPALGTLVYPLILCESAQWLISKRDIAGAVKCLRRVARINGRTVDDTVFDEFSAYYRRKIDEEQSRVGRKDNFLDMFRWPRLRKFTIILLLKSMIVTLSFDIVNRNMEGLGTSPFQLFSYSSLSYIPAGLTIICVQRYIGRKGMACASLFVGGIITIATGYIIAFFERAEHATLLALMVTLSRYGSVVAYDAEAQYAAEIIPTCVRGQGVANIHVAGYAFNFLSAYILFSGNYFKALPSILIGAILLVGAALCMLLPETMGRKLPETLADGDAFGADEKWYYLFCFQRKKPEIEVTKL